MRISDIKTRLVEKDRLARTYKEDENRLVAEFKEKEALMQQLTGEKNTIEGSHKKIREEYAERQQSR